ncbi:ribosome quality control complex subunit NEMF homolog [Stomoxys calcitrans]|uniref:ribosome quality control complex subunit NEMF homolog n=1 Tax=Stomoxys calcitrans TaxID=35570 RepID=UPI0027E390C3|nr:ribosome quality control complex subunit NEMF homolog [Stomoxys calcitrans]
MKLRFNSFDIICGVTELQSLVGLRVNQIYDIDNKTYLIRLQGGGEAKKVLLLESGIRFHTTSFEWPKNMAPSGFSMKLRKHLKNKRLEKLSQVGTDRIVDFQFGAGEAAYHIILELYDRGNIVLTDHEMTIVYILRSHQEGEDVRFAIREKYPIHRAKQEAMLPSEDELINIINTSEPSYNMKNTLMCLLDGGPAVVEHLLKKYELDDCFIAAKDDNGNKVDDAEQQKKSKKNKNKREAAKQVNSRPFNIETDLSSLMAALREGNEILQTARQETSKGYIVQKKVEKPSTETSGGEVDHFYQNVEYHPLKFCQYECESIATFDSFMLAVDEFYSTLEGQKIDMKTLQQEKEALKKLSNVKLDHAKRLENLTKAQETDKQKAELITANQLLVDNAILAIRSAIANQMSWPDIHELVKAAQANGDPTAASINQLKLEINHITLRLSDPYGSDEQDEENSLSTLLVDVDLALSAWANARKYYDLKRTAAQKEQKTIDASQKALKSAERKTQQTLKDVRTISTISKARKVYWFEKFYWFISSENFLVIGGRDAQQNELIVKRYMRPNDIYVHAEIQGASSVIVRNPSGADVPPKTLIEAGTMAISYSVAWDAKVVTNAYWVRSDQVSKTAPTGEYLGTGSFMIRGKKNFLPSCHLIMGLTLLFKLEDSFVEKHRGERKVRTFEEEQLHNEQQVLTENEKLDDVEEVEVELDDDNEQPQSEYPDIQVKVEHDTGRITINNEEKTKHIEDTVETQKDDDQNEEESTIIAAAPSRKKHQMNAKKRKEEKERKTQQKQQAQRQLSEESEHRSNQAKRGQKGKLKKIRSKYKDQDEEERQLRMEILKSAGKKPEIVADPKLEECAMALKSNKPKQQPFEPKQAATQEPDDDDADEKNTGADVDMIDSLTGQPFEDDELLFVIPMIAPYQSIQHYKYKVKITPGTGKRGRAAKTALTMFSKDKMCTNREKDLLKSIKEEALARNIPGKVKLSAPQLQKFKK